jgi:pimeloyl-ACP methyl ester carboxylesterase
MLRGAALPGASLALRAATSQRTITALEALAARLERAGAAKAPYVRAVIRAVRPLGSRGSRRAFVETLRSVIDIGGQRVSAVDRLYLLGPVPVLIVWGERDRTIPIDHGRAARDAIPGSRFVTLPDAAHFPHLEDADGLAAALQRFIAGTRPHRIDEVEWARLVGSRTPRRRHLRAA